MSRIRLLIGHHPSHLPVTASVAEHLTTALRQRKHFVETYTVDPVKTHQGALNDYLNGFSLSSTMKRINDASPLKRRVIAGKVGRMQCVAIEAGHFDTLPPLTNVAPFVTKLVDGGFRVIVPAHLAESPDANVRGKITALIEAYRTASALGTRKAKSKLPQRTRELEHAKYIGGARPRLNSGEQRLFAEKVADYLTTLLK